MLNSRLHKTLLERINKRFLMIPLPVNLDRNRPASRGGEMRAGFHTWPSRRTWRVSGCVSRTRHLGASVVTGSLPHEIRRSTAREPDRASNSACRRGPNAREGRTANGRGGFALHRIGSIGRVGAPPMARSRVSSFKTMGRAVRRMARRRLRAWLIRLRRWPMIAAYAASSRPRARSTGRPIRGVPSG